MNRAIQAHKAQITLIDEFIREIQKVIQVVQPDPKDDMGPHEIIKNCKEQKAYLERLISLLNNEDLDTYANEVQDFPVNVLAEYDNDLNSGLMRELGRKYENGLDVYTVYEKYIEPLMED